MKAAGESPLRMSVKTKTATKAALVLGVHMFCQLLSCITNQCQGCEHLTWGSVAVLLLSSNTVISLVIYANEILQFRDGCNEYGLMVTTKMLGDLVSKETVCCVGGKVKH